MKNPPVDFLLVCSGVSLRDFELNRLNEAANLRKHIREIEADLRQAEAEATLARWLMEYRDVLLASRRVAGFQASFEFQSHPALPPAPAPVRVERKRAVSESRKEICA